MDAPDPVELVRVAAAFYRDESLRMVAVRERFGLSMTQFGQLVNAALADPFVVQAAPTEVARLIRIRDSRQRQRSVRRMAG